MSLLLRFLPRKFRVQISVLVLFMATTGIALFAFYMAKQQGNLVTQGLESTGNALSQNLAFDAARLLIDKDYASLELVLRQYGSLPDVLSIRVMDSDGLALIQVEQEANQLKVSYTLEPVILPASLRTQKGPVHELLKVSNALLIWRPVLAGSTQLGYVSITLSLRSSLSIQSQVYKNTFSFATVAVLLALLFLLMYLRKPIEAMQRASAFVAQLDVKKGHRLELESFAEEFETLTRALNQVSQRLYSKDQEVQSSQMRLEATLLNSVDGILMLDENLRISLVNPAVERLFGYSQSHLIGKSWSTLFDNSCVEQIDLEHATSQDLAVMAKHSKGYLFPVSFASCQLKVVGSSFYSLRIHDMTERYAYEKALKEREAEARKLSLVASRTSNAVVITDAKGMIEWVNEGFTRITGYELDEVKGKKPGHLLQGPETDKDVIARLRQDLSQNKSAQAELLNYSKSGRKYWVNLEIKPIFNQQGQLTNFMAIESDITERKQAAMALELALKEAESANHAKSEFLSRMSHELRTPLNAILGFGQLLELEDLPQRQKGAVDHILVAGRHLLELIEEILDISRIETGQMKLMSEQVDLRRVLEEACAFVRPMAEQKGISFHLEASEPAQVWIDLRRFKQVLLNVFSNAIKYNHEGGKVFISFKQQGQSCELRVRDTGMGIASSKLERLFIAFDRLDIESLGIEGTGIGLTLSKSLIEAMGGEIRVESQEGKGTCVILKLLAYQEVSSLTSAEVFPEPVLSARDLKTKLLYIEDNPSNIALVQAVLAMRSGLVLNVARSAQAGLEQIQKELPDILLLDLHLPDQDGKTFLEDLRLKGLKLPVLVLSADVSPARLAELERIGIEGFIAKPLDLKDLLAHIDRLSSVQKVLSLAS